MKTSVRGEMYDLFTSQGLGGGLLGLRTPKPTTLRTWLAWQGPREDLGRLMDVCLTQVMGSIRNSHLDKFLPPRRQKAEENSPQKAELQFRHMPITDLSIPTEAQ